MGISIIVNTEVSVMVSLVIEIVLGCEFLSIGDQILGLGIVF